MLFKAGLPTYKTLLVLLQISGGSMRGLSLHEGLHFHRHPGQLLHLVLYLYDSNLLACFQREEGNSLLKVFDVQKERIFQEVNPDRRLYHLV